VFGLDEVIARLGLGSGSALLALGVSLLLGLRHATDPDHLTAVSTLVLSERPGGGGRAGLLGLAWGAGHAVTLFACGLPVVLLGRALPDGVARAAELAVGVLIAALAVRLLVRWRRGAFHSHPHRHGALRHAHPHAHERLPGAGGDHAEAAHGHPHAEGLGRTPLAAFGIGLVHGVGGSAGAGVLVVAALPAAGVAALALFAAGTALSMALASLAFGHVLVRGAARRRLEGLVPVLGAASLLFGVWYALAAAGVPGLGR
jgi:ABC-type nickel/cobalt efflux system permease component RcnA